MSGIVGKCRDIENIQKIPFFEILFKHRHVTPRWKSFGLSITKIIILGHFDLFGPKNGPKGVKKGLKISFFEILFKHRHVTPRWKSFGLKMMNKIVLGHVDLFGPNFLTF